MTGEKVHWYENLQCTPQEMLGRIMDVEDCKKLVSRQMLNYNGGQTEKSLRTLWVQEPEHKATASYGSPWGFYTGMDSIYRYYVESFQKELGKHEGVSLFRAVNTPVVFLAGDGKTAQGMFLMSGEETWEKQDGTVEALHIYGRVAVDFIREKEGWRIWHWVDIYQMTNPVGEDIAQSSVTKLPEERVFRPKFMAASPDIPMVTHFPEYHDTDGWPQYPSAHETYDLDHSYGPEGHPGLQENVTDVNWAMRMALNKAWGRTVKQG